jgi:excisionase family DNA binding protein
VNRYTVIGDEYYYSVAETAKHLGVSRQRVHQMIKQGMLEAITDGNMKFIPKDAVVLLKGDRTAARILSA